MVVSSMEASRGRRGQMSWALSWEQKFSRCIKEDGLSPDVVLVSLRLSVGIWNIFIRVISLGLMSDFTTLHVYRNTSLPSLCRHTGLYAVRWFHGHPWTEMFWYMFTSASFIPPCAWCIALCTHPWTFLWGWSAHTHPCMGGYCP